MASNSYPPIGNESHDRSSISSNESGVHPPRTLWPQIFAAYSAVLGGLVMGTCIGWSGPVIHLLNDTTTAAEIPITANQFNFIASLMPAGALVGSLCGGTIMDNFGRKGSILGISVLFALSYLLLASAKNVWMLLIGRFLTGAASGMTTISAPTYVSEIASANIRGMLGSSFQLMVTIGVLYPGIIGAIASWRWVSVACIFWCLKWSICMWFCPESPQYLLSKKDVDGARQSLQFLRGHERIDNELALQITSNEEATNSNFQIRMLTKPSNAKPLGIAMMLMVGQQLSGCNAVLFFSVPIFSAANTGLNPFVDNIIIGTVQVLATALATLIIDKFGRRVLLITSAFFMIIAMYGLGLYFWLQVHNPSTAAAISILPLMSVCIFFFSFSLGFGPIPWLMMSELFSPEAKGIASSISSATNWILAFFVTQFFVPIKNFVGAAATFWFFATAITCIMAFQIFFVPETKGKSLEEIQNEFKGSREEDEESIMDNDSVAANIEEVISAENTIARD